jgi:hypothetical protein
VASISHPPLSKQDLALAEIEKAYQAKVSSVPWLMPPDYSVLFADIERAAETFLVDVTQTAAEPKCLTERIRKRRSALSLASDINTEVVGICKQVLAFGAAGLGLSLGFADKLVLLPVGLQKAIVIAGIVYFELVLVSLLVLFFYLLQARFRYPFLSFERIGNTWPWFYYASVSPEVPRAPVQTPREGFLAACLYGKDLVRFANKAIGETEQEELRVEIQQYFLLLAYQGYVHQFSLRLTNIFFAELLVPCLLALGCSCGRYSDEEECWTVNLSSFDRGHHYLPDNRDLGLSSIQF